MSPGDYQLLAAAATGAPGRGIRVTAARGVCRIAGGSWRRFEGPATLAAFVTGLDDQAVTLHRHDVGARVLLGDLVEVRADVAYTELAHPISLEEALSFSTFELAAAAVEEAA